MLISTGFCWCENNVLKEKKQNFVPILVKSIYSMAVFQSTCYALHSQTSLRLIYSDVHRLCCMSAHFWQNHWSVCGTLAMGWIGTSYALDHWGVFNFMQRHTDLQARVAACIRGRNWKRRREVWLFLLQVVMLSRGLDTRTTDEVNNCNICQMHRCFRNVFKSKKHFLYTA